MNDDTFRKLGDVAGEIVDHVTCRHAEQEIRYLATSNGQRQYKWQCLVCGQIVGSALAHAAVPDKENCKPIDQELRDRPWRERGKLQDEQMWARLARDEEESREWWDRYNEYLTTPEWASRRAAVLKRANGICEGCGVNRAAHVHHLTYDHVRNEFLWELVAICHGCHERCHPHLRRRGHG